MATKTITEILQNLEQAETSELIRHLVNQTMSQVHQIYALPAEGQTIGGKHQTYDELKKVVAARHRDAILGVSAELEKRFKEYEELKQYLPMLKYLRKHFELIKAHIDQIVDPKY